MKKVYQNKTLNVNNLNPKVSFLRSVNEAVKQKGRELMEKEHARKEGCKNGY